MAGVYDARVRPLVLFLFVAMACATPPPPRPAALDPSNPEAPEAPLPAASTALSDTPAAAPAAPPAPAKAGGYTCPMHPELVEPGPGRCPKCGMDLVPREAKPADDHQHHHGGAP